MRRATMPETKKRTRPLWRIAEDILANWQPPNYAAKPYILAMGQLSSIEEIYGADSARSIVQYFLSNANTWRGDHAKRIKAELREMLK